jgi:hypothetical protein
VNLNYIYITELNSLRFVPSPDVERRAIFRKVVRF